MDWFSEGRKVGDFTFSLFARPSAIEGVSRLVDFAGTLNEYNYAQSGAAADRLAILRDWLAIGQDYDNVLIEIAADPESPDLPEELLGVTEEQKQG